MGMSPRLLRPRASGFTPKNITGLVAWFDADDASTFTLSGTAVSEWRDKSGNGYAVSQSTGNNQPARTGTVNGRATVDFDGTNDYLYSDDTGLASSFNGDKTVFMLAVGEMHNAAEYAVNGQGTWMSWGSSSSGTPYLYMRSNAGSGASQVVLRNDASSGTGGITSSGPAGDGAAAGTAKDFFICSCEVPSQSVLTWRCHTVMAAFGDGIGTRPLQGVEFTGSVARPSGAVTVNRFTIGALGRNTFGDYYPARISEVVVYSRIPTQSERRSLVTYLSKKYNNVSTPVV